MITEINKKLLSIYFKSEIRRGIKDLRAYTNKIEKYLETEKSKLEERRDKESDKIEVEKDIEDILNNTSLQLGYGRHIEIFTKSAIVSIYTYLEFFLDDFCKKIHEYDKKSISPKELAGSGVTRSRLYLSKVLSINMDNLNPQWEELKKLNEIRNFLVHSNGVAINDEAKNNIQKTIKNISGVELEDDHIKVSVNYIKHILSVIESFLTEVELQYSKGVV